MIRRLSCIAILAALACGGQTMPAPSGTDAGPDVSDPPPIGECHGYCPQPNGASCFSDCDCYDKCIHGTCADPVAQSVDCDDAGACPSGQTCGPFGGCEGAACSTSEDCPIEQQCMSGKCSAAGCI